MVHYLLLCLFSICTYAQIPYLLKITANDSIENKIITRLNFQKTHLTENTLKKELTIITNQLKNKGYFYPTYKLTKQKNQYTYFFNLNKKIDSVLIHTNKNEHLKFPIEKLENYLTTVSINLDKKGKSFSEVSLKNIQLKNHILEAELYIKESRIRFIDKTIIKGYTKFPQAFIKHYLSINPRKKINKQNIDKINNLINSLSFVSTIKKPEILFSKDSTLLFLYLKKETKNYADGILNITTDDNQNVTLNGHIDIRLENILHTGETLRLFWESFNLNKSLEINANLPYIFNTKLSPSFRFKLHKQDSSFLNTTFNSNLSYAINPRSSFGLTYENINATNLLEQENFKISDFKSYFVGFNFSYIKKTKNNLLNQNKLLIQFSPSLGTKTSNNEKQTQLKLQTHSEYLFQLNKSSNILLRNHIGILNSKSYFDNELFRIGGINNLRGFRNQSILTNAFMILNTEYQYNISKNSQLYTVTDYANYQNTATKKINNAIGAGLGYRQLINNTLLSIAYSVGKPYQESFDFKNPIISIKILSFF